MVVLRSFFYLPLLGSFAIAFSFVMPNHSLGQSEDASQVTSAVETADEKRERVTAERFLQLLKRRPRLGTALDKVYGYHVGRGSLETFCETLKSEAEQAKDGKLWLVLGMVQMQRGQDALAVASLQVAEELLPEEPLASYYLGKTQVLLGEVDDAAAAMRRAVERKPARPDLLAVFQDLGRIYQRTGRQEEALEVWKQLEQSFPGDSQVKEEIASILAEEGALEAALERYTTLAEQLKDRFRQIEMRIRAAQLKAELGRNDDALADFEKQLAVINPDSWLHRDIRRRIEEVFWVSGNVDGLIDYYTKWVNAHPEDVDAMMRTARVLSIQRRMPEAEKWFRRAIDKAPSQTSSRMALVEALVTDGRYAEAAAEMEAVAKLEPDNPDYIVRWGELVFNDSKRPEPVRIKEAGDIWLGLLRKRGDDPVTVARVADLLRGSGASDAAIEKYEKAIALAPTEPQYREYLGEYLHQLGRKEEALATWRELASGDRKTRDNLVRLSEVLSTFRYAEEALSTMAAACELKPTFGHRARYAELLREAGQFDAALEQLELAEPLAEDPELRELVMEERIKNFQASGTLLEQIESAETAVAGPQKADPMAWRLLAMLRNANRKFQLACDAIDQATVLEPSNAMLWETAASLQERAGRIGDAISSYRKLATLDRRFLSNYLTQIASMEMRLGNTDAALKAAEELVASAPGNSDHYRFFADLCFQLGDSERAFEALRRNVRSNPNDEEALTYLARTLADEFETDEAIELYWRSFEFAKDIDDKSAVITPLVELYLRTNRFDTLLDRLEMTAREKNKPRDGTLWTAVAHQAAGDLGMAKQLLEQLARQDSRDTKLLEQLVTLSKSEYDYESAAEYQKRLVAASPTPENEYALANILLELGEIDQAESLWMKLSQRKNDPQAFSKSIDTLLQKEQYDTADALIQKALASRPGDWELMSQAMIVFSRLKKKQPAREMAGRILAMSIPPETPTDAVKAKIAQRASRRNSNTPTYDPYQRLGDPSRLLQVASQIRRALQPGSDDPYRSSRQQSFAPSCFQDAKAIAWSMPLVHAEEGFDISKFIDEQANKASQGDDQRELWKALYYVLWESPRVQYGQESDPHYDKCLNKLVELEAPAAGQLMMSSFMNRRQRQSNGDASQLKPLSTEEIEEVKRWGTLAASGAQQTAGNYYDLWIANELAKAGDEDGAEELIDRYVAAARNSPNATMMLLQAVSVLVNEQMNAKPTQRQLDKAKTLFQEALRSSKAGANANASYLGQMTSSLIDQFVKHDKLEDAFAMIEGALEWQAVQTAKSRPSQRDRLHNNGAPINYGRVVNRRYIQETIAFPPSSGYFGSESILAVYGLYQAAKEDPEKLAKVHAWLDTLTEEKSDDPYLNLARYLTQAAISYWDEQRDKTAEILSQASELGLGTQFVELARTRLLYEQGRVKEALAAVEKLRPTNQRMLVDRELTILQLLLQLGDLERSKKSAQKLFALRLDSETEFRLSDLMYQLGMRELGDRMMGRIRRRAGGKQDTLVQLMQRYANANDNEAASEIARQVIRRTSPRGSVNYYTTENQQHEQAVRILAQTKQLRPLIEQYEKLVERSPKSTKLVDKLAAFYEAAGRREDAQKLRLKSVDNGQTDPKSLFAAGQQLAKARNHAGAVEKYLDAIKKSPEMLNRNYYEMRSSFDSAMAWPKFVDVIVAEGIQKYRQSYRFDEICRELANDKEYNAINRLLVAAMKGLSFQEMSQIFYSFSRIEFEPSEELLKLLREKLCNKEFVASNVSPNFVSSRSSNGRTSGFVNGIVAIVRNDKDLTEEVKESMAENLAKDEKQMLARVLLAHLQAASGEFEPLRDTMAPLMNEKEKNNQHGEAIWSIASTLSHDHKKYKFACELLESVKKPEEVWQSNSDFQFTAQALMAYSLEQAGRRADARKMLLSVLKTTKVDEQRSRNNPGYGEYNFIRAMSSLSERFVNMGYPAEAYIAFQKAYRDDSLVGKARAWSSSVDRNKQRIEQQIKDKTTPEKVLEIVKACLHSGGDQPSIGDQEDPPNNEEGEEIVADQPQESGVDGVADFLTEPQIQVNSLVDTRVSMLLEEFLGKIANDEQLKESVTSWLRENQVQESARLKLLVTRLLVCDSVQDNELTETVASEIVAWIEAHPPDEGKVERDGLPDELLLGMAALRMPDGSAEWNAKTLQLLERAAKVAEASKQADLLQSLRCQIARRIAKERPEEARQILLDTLERILPAQDQESNAAEVSS